MTLCSVTSSIEIYPASVRQATLEVWARVAISGFDEQRPPNNRLQRTVRCAARR
jgi:hypothetical protein